MNKKGILVGMVVVIVVCVALFFLQVPKKEAQKRVVTAKVVDELGEKEIQAILDSSLANGLSKDTVMFVVFSAENFQPFSDFVQNQRKRFGQTKLWKQYEVDKKIDQVLESPPVPVSPSDNVEALGAEFSKIVREVIPLMERGGLVVSSETVPVTKKLGLPRALVVLKFADASAVEKISTILDRTYNWYEEEIKKNPSEEVVLTKLKDGLHFEVTDKREGVNFTGALKASANNVSFVFGGEDEKQFFTEKGESLLSDAENRSVLEKAILARPAVLSYMDYRKFFSYMTELFGRIGSISKDTDIEALREQFLDKMEGVAAMGGALNFLGGINSKACFSVESESPADTFYKEMLARSAAAQKSDFSKYVTENTIVALRSSTAQLEMGLEGMKRGLASAAKESSSTVSDQELKELITAIEKSYKKLGYGDLGILVSSSQFEPFPGVGLFLGGGKVKGDEALKEIKGLYEKISSLAKSKSQITPELGSASDGTTQLVFQVDPTFKIVARPVGANSLFITHSQALMQKTVALSGEETRSYLEILLAQNDLLDEGLRGQDYWLYVATRPALDMIKAFVPMFAAQTQQQGISADDIRENLSLLETMIFGYQQTYRHGEQMYCMSSSVTTLNPLAVAQ